MMQAQDRGLIEPLRGLHHYTLNSITAYSQAEIHDKCWPERIPALLGKDVASTRKYVSHSESLDRLAESDKMACASGKRRAGGTAMAANNDYEDDPGPVVVRRPVYEAGIKLEAEEAAGGWK